MNWIAAFVLLPFVSVATGDDTLRKDLTFLAGDELNGRGGGQQGERLAATYIADAFASCGLTQVTDSGYWQSFEFEAARPGDGPARLTSQNVLGLLTGTRRDEVVMLGGHYDGVGAPGEPDPGREHRLEDAGDSIWNGANDNASSIALMLEVMRELCRAESRPARSILFAAFGAEEHGLGGSFAFVDEPPIPLDRLVAFVNLEQVGSRPGDELIAAATGTSPMWGEALEWANERSGADTSVAIEALIADTDHYAPALAGVPSITVGHGDGPEGHTPGDDLSVIDFPSLAQRARFVRALLEVVADWRGRPVWSVETDRFLGLAAAAADAGERAAAGLADAQGALKIVSLLNSSQAATVGLRVGDLIVAIDGEPVAIDAIGPSLNYRMLDKPAGAAMTLDVLRAADDLRVTICKGPCSPR